MNATKIRKRPSNFPTKRRLYVWSYDTNDGEITFSTKREAIESLNTNRHLTSNKSESTTATP